MPCGRVDILDVAMKCCFFLCFCIFYVFSNVFVCFVFFVVSMLVFFVLAFLVSCFLL